MEPFKDGFYQGAPLFLALTISRTALKIEPDVIFRNPVAQKRFHSGIVKAQSGAEVEKIPGNHEIVPTPKSRTLLADLQLRLHRRLGQNGKKTRCVHRGRSFPRKGGKSCPQGQRTITGDILDTQGIPVQPFADPPLQIQNPPFHGDVRNQFSGHRLWERDLFPVIKQLPQGNFMGITDNVMKGTATLRGKIRSFRICQVQGGNVV